MTKAEKMREQFEAEFVEEYVRVLGEGSRELAVHTLGANPPLVSMCWWAWQASREAVVVELPDMGDKKYWEYFEDVEVGSFVFPKYIAHVETAIKVHGLKVAP